MKIVERVLMELHEAAIMQMPFSKRGLILSTLVPTIYYWGAERDMRQVTKIDILCTYMLSSATFAKRFRNFNCLRHQRQKSGDYNLTKVLNKNN